jgi:predicted small secreted protein
MWSAPGAAERAPGHDAGQQGEMKAMLVRWAAIAALTLASFTFSACRTMEGLGEDLSVLGNKISGKAREKAGD